MTAFVLLTALVAPVAARGQDASPSPVAAPAELPAGQTSGTPPPGAAPELPTEDRPEAGRASAASAAPAELPAGGRHDRSGAPQAGEAKTGTAVPDRPAAMPVFETVVSTERPLSRDQTQDATEVDGKKLRDSARATTFEALSQESAAVYVPGHGAIHGVGNGATGSIHVRGLGGSPNSQVLVVEDGVPDYQGIFGHPIPDAYAPFLIDDVLVVKGGDSVLYGTNAMGAVVVIRSRWRRQDGYELQSDTAYGSYSTLRQSASLLEKSGGLDVAAGFSALATDGHREGAGGSTLVGTVALRYRLGPNLRLTLRNKAVHLRGGDPGPETHPTPENWFDVWRDDASLRLAYTHGALRLRLVPYLDAGIHRLYDGFLSHDYVGGGIGEMELRLHRATSLLVGVATERVTGTVEDRLTGERPDVRGRSSASLYGQLTARPVDRLVLVLGARGLFSSEYGLVFLYKAGARLQIGRGFFLHGRVSRSFRQPTIRELYLPYPVANPGLQPEYALGSDLGIGYQARHFEATCTAYRTDARDLIKYFGAWPAAEVVNIDHVTIWGVEGRLGLERLGPLSLSASGDWQDVGRYTRQSPSAKVDLSVAAEQELGDHFIGGSLTAEWVHGLYMADYGRQPLADAFVMDLALRYRYTSPSRGISVEPYLLLRNLLDRRYAYVEGYPMPGFNLLAGLRMEI